MSPAPVSNLADYRARRAGTEPYVRLEAVAEHFAVSTRTAYRWNAQPGFPKEQLSSRMVRYRLSEVERWVRENCA